ncbi:mitochondrial 54S ribosomal protein YmL41 [Exophiala xenobiotica]|nr:mitochondrial 54S ribosomal protein YmL41 [Exophiala xenobiotica]KAK5216363.1 mitochondrial 54S ribosomal protein YmL41 [Exophiala xenobiotica]KAK5289067.1 mitochondrial 54S ribosomal protein YmL41 [Exophiala xenobiotica]KAK5315710.1 mitochondrial 54S ribosomal protein YmL41 [Exophiala xenobiotica]KAK5422512.1 mitochondrial 54S ribosomal protein YmL41 [Exophiala xenobiotica]
MPRARLPPTLYTKSKNIRISSGPRLWNAKRRIRTSIGLTLRDFETFRETRSLERWFKIQSKNKSLPAAHRLNKMTRQALRETRDNNGDLEWWKLKREDLDSFMNVHPGLQRVSSDVRDFIYANRHTFNRDTILKLLENPSRFFAASSNVPYEFRKQVFFPDPKDTVVLMRTPHLSPNYAAFDVPRHFSKLDLKAYLKNVYNVDVLHIRSVVVQQKVDRKQPVSQYTQGPLYRPASIKKMTVQLAKPFVYPEEIKDLDPWERDDFWTAMKAEFARQRMRSSWGTTKPNVEHRKSIAQQAQDLLKGKTKWAPTWQALDDKPVSESVARR